MIGRLAGETAIREAERIAVGSGSLTADSSKAIRADWVKAANGGREPKPRAATARDFSAARIKVTIEPPKPKA